MQLENLTGLPNTLGVKANLGRLCVATRNTLLRLPLFVRIQYLDGIVGIQNTRLGQQVLLRPKI